MRVIAGAHKGRILKTAHDLSVRPATGKVRAAIFNVLQNRIDLTGARILDLYAGSGSLGIEALSRGARLVILVEAHPATARLADENLNALGIKKSAEVIQSDAVQGLEKMAARHLLADFIFLDPPYEDTTEHLKVLDYLDTAHLIAPYGLVIVEHHHKMELPGRFDRLERTRLLEQGDATLSFYGLAAAA